MKRDSNKLMPLLSPESLHHPWLMNSDSEGQRMIVKKKGQIQIKQEIVASNSIKISLKELLNVSSEWKDVNKKNLAGLPQFGGGLPLDFQAQQIERIVEAIALTLPSVG